MSTETLSPFRIPSGPAPARPRPGVAELALADLLAGLASADELWSHFIPALEPERSGVHLLETDVLDVWLLGWPPGTRVEPHDHGDSAGAFTVVRGTLTEIRWSPAPHSRLISAGEVVTVARGVVHDVVAAAAAENLPALSLHAYSPPLRSMGFYTDDGSRLIGEVAVDPEPTVLR